MLLDVHSRIKAPTPGARFLHQAKTRLSRLLERVAAGEEIVIAKNGKPLAKFVPFCEMVQQLGRLKGKIKISRDFAAPLPVVLAATFREEGMGDYYSSAARQT